MLIALVATLALVQRVLAIVATKQSNQARYDKVFLNFE